MLAEEVEVTIAQVRVTGKIVTGEDGKEYLIVPLPSGLSAQLVTRDAEGEPTVECRSERDAEGNLTLYMPALHVLSAAQPVAQEVV